MNRRFVLTLVVFGVLAANSGCAINRATASVAPDSELSKLKSFYVVQRSGDERGIEKLISDNLSRRGYIASSGPEMPQPVSGVDAVVTYVDRWFWDITMYMLELTVSVRNPTNNFPMATGNSLHTSLTRKSPPEMVDEVLTNIFSAQPQK